MIIRNAAGAVLGEIVQTPAERLESERKTSETLARMRAELSAGSSSTERRATYPKLGAMRAAGRRWTHRAGVTALGLLALGAVISACSESEPSGAYVPTDVRAEVSALDFPTVLDSSSFSPTASYSGSTAGDATAGWNAAEIDTAGVITVNGWQVDDVTDSESPLRARYLESLERQGERVGSDVANVAAGVQFCGELAEGRQTALREASDARSDVPSFNTPARRMAIASASLVHFCPRFA